MALVGMTLVSCSGSDDQDPAPPSGSAPSAEPGEALQTLSDDGLPADFPRDRLPLIEGDVASAVQEDGWTVAVLTDASPAAAVADAVGRLEQAGWTAQTDLAGDPPPVQVLSNGSDQAIITTEQTDDQTLVTYAADLS